MKVYEAINCGAKELKGVCDNPRLEAELLLAHCFKINRTALFLRREEEISKEQLERFLEFVNMRKSHIPYQYIVKKQYFMGLEFFVDENVLIPRPETEILVEEALKRLKRGDVVLDIGTGSGAIAVSIAKYFPDCTVYAVDISKKAIEIAKHNAKKQGVLDRIFFIESDLFCNLPPNLKFDFIVSNPPYIKKREIELLQEEVKKEPIVALDGGEDGLFFYKKIIREAPFYIKSGGKIGFEIGYSQKEEVTTLLEESGFKDVEIIKDLAGIDRVIIAEHKL
ncbi:peptide chain release factor N(5)-glutamine methyltransferase [Thermoanaerobacter sp. CM-CNRG TB177]|uniref:peptide chain release factor N(5)-glutamine methyltransferase n=1 Tax=Thermoanaerobacter sp. CM-CNRG TB177 TaxID=2800659 RepID=UPI001BDE2392|nr:peptide chain release factor N(5)-glutamine methyltransferase [Thermoanaerobacter sp. CM-CNRG TB177]MBT1279103.1 peptide chain release factor N(5)-glutamine methyltransferase [Thermoanaerobacter sp. CM-CNRG TB177]